VSVTVCSSSADQGRCGGYRCELLAARARVSATRHEQHREANHRPRCRGRLLRQYGHFLRQAELANAGVSAGDVLRPWVRGASRLRWDGPWAGRQSSLSCGSVQCSAARNYDDAEARHGHPVTPLYPTHRLHIGEGRMMSVADPPGQGDERHRRHAHNQRG